jgi:hypothetical protein
MSFTRQWEPLWTFNTARFRVELAAAPDADIDLSWDDTGETRENIESGLWGVYVFRVAVFLDGKLIAQDTLGNSIYENPSDFAREHFGIGPQRRKAGCLYCVYFPGMVRDVIAEARKLLSEPRPRLRLPVIGEAV